MEFIWFEEKYVFFHEFKGTQYLITFFYEYANKNINVQNEEIHKLNNCKEFLFLIFVFIFINCVCQIE